jgi:hypothetical protein
LVVRYDGRFWQIERDSYHHAPAQAKVVVPEWENGKLEIRYRERKIAWKEIRALPSDHYRKDGLSVYVRRDRQPHIRGEEMIGICRPRGTAHNGEKFGGANSCGKDAR